VAVVPVPLAPEAFDLPDWDPSYSWTLTCRHEVLGPATAAGPAPSHAPIPAPPPPRSRSWSALRRGFERVQPWLDPETVARLTRTKRRLAGAVRGVAGRSPFALARDGYRRHVRRWLSDEAVARVTAVKEAALALAGREPKDVFDPPLPSGELTLGGRGELVYLTIFNLGDRRKNWRDMMSAFLTAFRDRPDVTLVIKLVTNPRREFHEAGVLRAAYRAMGIAHCCRLVVITEFLSASQMDDLFRVSAFYLNASHAEGACLPLMRALAGGRPSIAPAHTAMADYMDDTLGFVPRAFPEPTYWPHDPDQKLETYRFRPLWSDLRDALLASAAVADSDPARYAAMASAARTRMHARAGRDAAAEALRRALERLDGASAVGHAANAEARDRV
jgi:glycosyltransferase involved in cell wall biosynthesis